MEATETFNIFKWLTENVGLITTIVGLLTVFAIFRAPIVALNIQKKLEDFNEKKSRRLNIFKTLSINKTLPTNKK